MGLENTSLFVFFRGVILLYAVFHAGVESSALSRSTYFTTLTNKRLKGFVVKRFKSTSQIWCSQSCLKNAWCTSTNFKLTPQTSKSDGKGTCELNKHDVIKENAHLQFEAEVIFSTLIKDCRLAASTCLNGGVCFYDEKKQTYSCQCKPPWTGETCADLFTCDSHPCKNNGTCTDEVNEYNCSCAPGFYGTQCEKIEGLSCSSVTCDSHPCKNNGTCTDEVNEYNCSCAPGFYGTQCEKIEGLSCSSGLVQEVESNCWILNCVKSLYLKVFLALEVRITSNELTYLGEHHKLPLTSQSAQGTFFLACVLAMRKPKQDFSKNKDNLYSGLCFVVSYSLPMVFGQPCIKSYASIRNAISSSLSEFTMCLFVKMKDTNLTG
ncbi:unnamed protein product [Pocillopora meandrina]|uniref:Uncharacterized protein n=1 Tax=Pocillopora meandrina TaxID=46732 RepID=A0AAU9VR17_9CNID|nr:unnamed protein product [Pocillopora meandrina]